MRDPIVALRKALESNSSDTRDQDGKLVPGRLCRCGCCVVAGEERPVSLPYSVLVELLKRIEGGK
jgi:hypothetical protein